VTSTGEVPLRITICWSDPPGTIPPVQVDPTNTVLVNDLDLRVVSSGGTTNYPWVLYPANPTAAATTGDNSRDNVEQVVINNPTPGIYTVRVNYKGTLSNGLQNVSMILSGVEASPKPELAITHFEVIPEPDKVLEWPSVPGQLYRVETVQELSGTSWTNGMGDICAIRTNVVFADFPSTDTNRMFYRVRELKK